MKLSAIRDLKSIVFEAYSVAISFALQQNNKIVLAAFTQTNKGDVSFAMPRLLTDGTLNKEFNDSGKVIENFLYENYCRTVFIKNDGKIVLTGYSIKQDAALNDINIVLARYLGDPINDIPITKIKRG